MWTDRQHCIALHTNAKCRPNHLSIEVSILLALISIDKSTTLNSIQALGPHCSHSSTHLVISFKISRQDQASHLTLLASAGA
jgi:hypothetical protein